MSVFSEVLFFRTEAEARHSALCLQAGASALVGPVRPVVTVYAPFRPEDTSLDSAGYHGAEDLFTTPELGTGAELMRGITRPLEAFVQTAQFAAALANCVPSSEVNEADDDVDPDNGVHFRTYEDDDATALWFVAAP